jgi:DNA-binding transcriptional MerR regulator
MEWSIQELARVTGVTSRTLRHYDDIGLLAPSRVGRNGYRHYDQDALVRLQRILLLRELGLGLSAIAELLEGQRDPTDALRTHLELLEWDRDRIGRQIESVKETLRMTERGERLVVEKMFDGFDHTRYKQEVVDRWGREAYDQSDQWYRSLSAADRQAFQQEGGDIVRAFGAANLAGKAVGSDEVQALARRKHEWIGAAWQDNPPTSEQFIGMGEMYVDDARFAATYDSHGEGTAVFVRDAMRVYAEQNLAD